MKRLMIMLIILVGLVLAGQAQAQTTRDVELTWNHVTTYTDGMPLRPETLTARQYAIYYGVGSRGPATTPPDGNYTDIQQGIAENSVILTGFVEGVTYYFSATAYYINSAGDRIESEYSNEVSQTIPVEIEVDTNILASPVILHITIRPKTP